MLKFNKGAVIRAALFFFFLIPVVLTSCRNNDNKKTKVSVKEAVAPDSSSLLVLDKLIRENPKNPELFAKRAKFYSEKKN